MTRLEAIKKRQQAATKGPCVVGGDECSAARVITETEREALCEVFGLATTYPQDASNAEFIAHNFADVPWMRERLEELELLARAATGDTTRLDLASMARDVLANLEAE